MKTKILAFAGILVALAALMFVFPIGATAGMETTACPDTLCIISQASQGGGPSIIDKMRCTATCQEECNDCCDGECGNQDHVVGVGWCYCTQGDEWNRDCPW